MRAFPQVTAFACFLTLAADVSASVRIDLGMFTGRNDTATEGWHEWQVPDGESASAEFDGCRITLRPAPQSHPQIVGEWYKRGLASGATMATDGVTVAGGAGPAGIEIVLEGLPAGRHSLVTYHNALWSEPSGPYLVFVDNGPGPVAKVAPSRRVETDLEAASAYIEFVAEADRPVVVRVESEDLNPLGRVVLNGLEIGGIDPQRKAILIQPEARDWHVDGDNGTVELRWRPALNGKTVVHHLYFAAGDTLDEAIAAVSDASAEEATYVGAIRGTTHQVQIEPRNSLRFYAWRVDSEDRKGRVIRGEVWPFRIRHLAFPGAEGHGRFAIGGRGGAVIKVTNLNDSGPGSLRAAVEAEGPRTVIFDVSGRIELRSKLVIRHPFLTIAGETAPGDGICISNFNLGMLGAHDVIVRHLRVRVGDASGERMEGISMASSEHVIFDHCSISWFHDEGFAARDVRNVTFQNGLIAEGLGGPPRRSGDAHAGPGPAAQLGGELVSFHRNVIAHSRGWLVRLSGGLNKASRHAGRVDVRNNVFYNWSDRTVGGGASEVQLVSNFYKPGPASSRFTILEPDRRHVGVFGPLDFYLEGNFVDGVGPAGGRLGGELHPEYVVDAPFFAPAVQTRSAAEAFHDLMLQAGAHLPVRDAFDQRVLQEVRDGSASNRGSLSGLPGMPDLMDDVRDRPHYRVVRREAGWDRDGDGLPDHWERERGLNPADPTDAALDPDRTGYTFLERYLHELAGGGGQQD